MNVCFKCYGARVLEHEGRRIVCSECKGMGHLSCCGEDRPVVELPDDDWRLGVIIARREVLDGLENEKD